MRLTTLWVPACPYLPLRSWSLASTEVLMFPGPEGQQRGAQAHKSIRAGILRGTVGHSLL